METTPKKTKAEYQREYEKRTGRAAIKKYNAENTINFPIRLNKRTEQDIIGWLYAQPNKAGAIKQLIRADIAQNPD